MFALSALYEGFARGLVSLHTPPLLGRKPSSAKSRVSISSKLIEIKRLQPHYFGHLRKTGGRGSYQLLTRHPLFPPHSPLACPGRSRRGHSPSSISCISPAYELQPRMSLVSPTYAKTGGCTPVQKCRRADILDFSPYFSHFACPERSRRACPESDRRVTARHLPASEGGRYKRTERSREWPRNWPPVCYINTVLRAYCVSPSQNGTYQNPGYFREPAQRVCRPFVYRCPDADD